MTFHVGQRVVCIDDGASSYCWDGDEAPERGKIYTVRRAFVLNGKPILWLDEIKRSALAIAVWRNPDLGYGAFRFRPVIERKTDISVFQKMLTPADKVSAKPRVLSSSAP